MQIPRDAVLLRIFIGESERSNHKPLYEAIVLKARELQLSGATVPAQQLCWDHGLLPGWSGPVPNPV